MHEVSGSVLDPEVCCFKLCFSKWSSVSPEANVAFQYVAKIQRGFDSRRDRNLSHAALQPSFLLSIGGLFLHVIEE
jgi:hypothetical protein